MLARPKRFELLTPRFVVWCSIQLSYGLKRRKALDRSDDLEAKSATRVAPWCGSNSIGSTRELAEYAIAIQPYSYSGSSSATTFRPRPWRAA